MLFINLFKLWNLLCRSETIRHFNTPGKKYKYIWGRMGLLAFLYPTILYFRLFFWKIKLKYILNALTYHVNASHLSSSSLLVPPKVSRLWKSDNTRRTNILHENVKLKDLIFAKFEISCCLNFSKTVLTKVKNLSFTKVAWFVQPPTPFYFVQGYFLSFSLAQGPPSDLQIIAYK